MVYRPNGRKESAKRGSERDLFFFAPTSRVVVAMVGLKRWRERGREGETLILISFPRKNAAAVRSPLSCSHIHTVTLLSSFQKLFYLQLNPRTNPAVERISNSPKKMEADSPSSPFGLRAKIHRPATTTRDKEKELKTGWRSEATLLLLLLLFPIIIGSFFLFLGDDPPPPLLLLSL